METYTIKKAYNFEDKMNEIEIKSKNLLFVEMDGMQGCQLINDKNRTQILNKLKQISKLIKEVDELNK